jgi:hypothetical protein
LDERKIGLGKIIVQTHFLGRHVIIFELYFCGSITYIRFIELTWYEEDSF